MKKYSITEAAKLAGVNRATVYRWIQRQLVPAPLTEVVAGVHVTYWTDKEVARLKEHKAKRYWGQGKTRSRRNKPKE
jgi:transposase